MEGAYPFRMMDLLTVTLDSRSFTAVGIVVTAVSIVRARQGPEGRAGRCSPSLAARGRSTPAPVGQQTQDEPSVLASRHDRNGVTTMPTGREDRESSVTRQKSIMRNG